MPVLTIIRFIALSLILCNIPGFLLLYFGPTWGSLSSYLSSGLLILYFLLVKPKHKLLLPFILLGILYFTLSSLNFTSTATPDTVFFKDFIRFMIVVVCGGELVSHTQHKDIFFLALLGGVSVLINALMYPETNALYGLVIGRYSGFYLNPNYAASICLIGYALAFSIKTLWWRYLGQAVFTLAGLFTLSRTFIVLWLLINIVAIIRNRKNALAPIVGGAVLICTLIFTDTGFLNANRFEAYSSVFDDGPVKTQTLEKDTRMETWAQYYDMVFEKPFLGHGYTIFSTKEYGLPGAHNTYLLVIGEAGVLPLLVLLGIYAYLLIGSLRLFSQKPELFYIATLLTMGLMVGHGYFSNFSSVLMAMYLFSQIQNANNQNSHLPEKPTVI